MRRPRRSPNDNPEQLAKEFAGCFYTNCKEPPMENSNTCYRHSGKWAYDQRDKLAAAQKDIDELTKGAGDE